jgi:hypothetical protein
MDYLSKQEPSDFFMRREMSSFVPPEGAIRRGMPEFPMRRWRADLDLYAVCLTADAVVAVCGNGDTTSYVPRPATEWHVAAFGRTDGDRFWEVGVPFEPLLDGLCVDREGRVILSGMDGRLMAVQTDGKTETAKETRAHR